ncbi:unnamed protein product [Nippostrongylus brasiliensis]|uniref:ADF-H domain-containing protein n=1 Tax=Nippostrongylus brasiliensis TaxID=27835 RepID=A0A0N4XID3_NIPBR|nr:unnamed protein product [Nippostrongylus brasiliensis]
MVLRLAQLECSIILSARRKEKLDELKAKCDEKSSTRSSVVFPLDVTNFQELPEKCRKVRSFYGKVRFDLCSL